jgi:hypothetical protein
MLARGKMVILNCGLVEDRSVVSILIEEWKTVGLLKDAIAGKLKYTGRADQLQLFLAKKKTSEGKGKGPWVVTNEVESGWSETSDLKPLNAAAALNLYGLSETGVQLEVPLTEDDADAGRMPVHVLVVVPGGAVGSASETSKLDQLSEKFDKMNDKLDKTVLGKRKVCHSSANSSLLDDLHVRLRASRPVPFETEKHVEPFTWGCIVDEHGQKIKLTGEQQRERYRNYVEVNIGDALAKNKLCVYGVEKGEGGKDILSADVPGHDIKLAGRTDMIILSDQVLENQLELEMLPDVRLIIEVKQKVERRSVSQTVSELIALDIRAAEPAMALLTDLQKHWQFFWVADPINNRGTIESVTICDPSKAFAVIETLLASGADAVVSLPCFNEPIKRLKIDEFLVSIGEGGGTSIRESIERYYDIASILGPDMDMARAVAEQITRSIPTLSYFS